MPYVILEAKAAARPVAVSLVSGMEEFVRHAEDGFLVRPGDAEAWAQVLTFMVERPEALRCAGRRARGSLRPEWHARRCVGRLQALYRELLAERKERSPAAPPGDHRI
jgi:glycosyltransferase involved in cell wall biosynthesis